MKCATDIRIRGPRGTDVLQLTQTPIVCEVDREPGSPTRVVALEQVFACTRSLAAVDRVGGARALARRSVIAIITIII